MLLWMESTRGHFSKQKIVSMRKGIPSAMLLGVNSACAAHGFGLTASGKRSNGGREAIDSGIQRFFDDAALRLGNDPGGFSRGERENWTPASHVHENFGGQQPTGEGPGLYERQTKIRACDEPRHISARGCSQKQSVTQAALRNGCL